MKLSVAQEAMKFPVYFYDECLDSIVKYDYIYNESLEAAGEIILIPKMGCEGEEDCLARFATVNTENFYKNDTIFLSAIGVRVNSLYAGHIFQQKYFKCNVLCDGKVGSYDSGGKLRISGVYEEGFVKELTEYDANGRVMKITNYNVKAQKKGGVFTEAVIKKYTYDDQRNMIHVESYNSKNGVTVLSTYKNGKKLDEFRQAGMKE